MKPEAQSWNWKLMVVNDPSRFTHSLNEGKIVAFTGMERVRGLSDDEMAVAIALAMSQSLNEEQCLHLYSEKKQSGAVLSAKSTKAQAMRMLRFSLLESDRMGVEMVARAGFNPEAAIDWTRKAFASTSEISQNKNSPFPTYGVRMAGVKRAIMTANETFDWQTRAMTEGTFRLR